jgi:hypothetical protein
MKRVVLLLYFLIGTGLCFGSVIHVPSDQPTIQEGINVASDYDTIVVADGHYYERLNLIEKAVLLASGILSDGDSAHVAATIIDADTSVLGISDTGSVINAWGYEGYYKPVEIRGFTLRGAPVAQEVA